MVVRPEFARSVMPESFTSAFWGSRARPVALGGRGAAWFVSGSKKDWILRYYQRGGLIAHISNDAHWFLGRKSVRSFAEFHLLNQLYHLGLPVPKPVAAGYYRFAGFWYRAQIILETIPDAKPFSSCLLASDDELWYSVGQLIRRFHDHGVYHADLNCHNILVSASGLYLVDFDKSRIRRGSRWKRHNLKRLRRSIDKVLGGTDAEAIHGRWQKLLQGYETGCNGQDALAVLASYGLLPLVSAVSDLGGFLM